MKLGSPEQIGEEEMCVYVAKVGLSPAFYCRCVTEKYFV